MTLPASPDVVIDSEETVWNGRFRVEVVHFRHRRFDGTFTGTKRWEMMMRGKAAALLAYDPDQDRVVLIEQFRLPALAAGTEPVLTELAAGLLDAGELAEEAIRREAREELGLEVGALLKVGDFLLTPGGSDELCTLFAGRVTLGEVPADGILGIFGLDTENEDIRVRAVDARDAIENAIAGRYVNSVASIGLLWFGHRRDALRAEWLKA